VRSNLLRRFSPVIFITLVVLVTTSLLSLTKCATWERLEAQQDQQTLALLKGIFPEANFYTYEDGIYTVYNDGRNETGYAFLAIGKGYSGNIVILVGLEDKETIKGVTIISHNETLWMGGEEGGSPLSFSPLVDQFVGLKIEDCALKKNDGQVDGITGATTSSRAVVDAVRETALEKVKSIR
jgi:electron transport complex protein RnfG